MTAQTLSIQSEPSDSSEENLQLEQPEAAEGPKGEQRLLIWSPKGGEGPPQARRAPIDVWTGWALLLCSGAVLGAGLQLLSGQAQVGFVTLALALILAGAAGWSDLATRRISNRLTYPAILLALLLNLGIAPLIQQSGWQTAHVWLGSPGVPSALQGFALCAVVGVFGFSMRGLGGGDVKAMVAVGTLVGFSGAVSMLFNTLLVAAVLGVLNLASGGRFFASLQASAFKLHARLVAGARDREVLMFRPNEGPFAFSMALGLVVAQFVAIHELVFLG